MASREVLMAHLRFHSTIRVVVVEVGQAEDGPIEMGLYSESESMAVHNARRSRSHREFGGTCSWRCCFQEWERSK